MSVERITTAEEQFLKSLSWVVLAAAAFVVCAVGWQLWQTQGRMEMLYHGKAHMLPLGMRALLACPAVVFAAVPLAAVAAGVGVQMRYASRVVTTLFHLFVLGAGLACSLVVREVIMAGVIAQAFGGTAGR